jgi:hypothetical protein
MSARRTLRDDACGWVTLLQDESEPATAGPSFRAQVVELEGAPEERKRAHSDVRALSTAAGQRTRSAA